MAIAAAIQISMKSLVELCTTLSPDVAVCIRGKHAVGKSEGVTQIATHLRSDFYKNPENCARMVKHLGAEPTVAKMVAKTGGIWTYDMGMPVIQRRLSQMTEGDLTGCPAITDRGTVFKPCAWLLDACDFPTVLFLDERNRALDGVKQAAFELCDSKAFYGNRLAAETRIYIAENVGDQYSVNSNDPAEISRAATVELNPSVDEWISYCISQGVHAHVTDFIRTNKNHLEHTAGAFEANKKYPDRRTWFKLATELQRTGLIDHPESPLFHVMCGSMVGVEASLDFKRYVTNIDKNISSEDIVTDWEKAKKKGGTMTQERYMELSKKLTDFFKKTKMTAKQGEQVSKYMHDAPAEPRTIVWAALQADMKNLFVVHGHVAELMVKTAAGQNADMGTGAAKTTVAAPKAKR